MVMYMFALTLIKIFITGWGVKLKFKSWYDNPKLWYDAMQEELKSIVKKIKFKILLDY